MGLKGSIAVTRRPDKCESRSDRLTAHGSTGIAAAREILATVGPAAQLRKHTCRSFQSPLNFSMCLCSFIHFSMSHHPMQLKFWMTNIMKWESGQNALLLVAEHRIITTWPLSLVYRVRKVVSIDSAISQPVSWAKKNDDDNEICLKEDKFQ